MESTLLVKFWPHLLLYTLVKKNPLFCDMKNALTPLIHMIPKHIRDLVNCANTSIFKRALDYHLCSIEDSPMVQNECNSLTSRSKENEINKKWRAAIADQAE